VSGSEIDKVALKAKCVASIQELSDITPRWRELVAQATESNISYEPEPLISLLKNIDYAGWFVLTVWDNTKLVGFFPMLRERSMPLPIDQVSLLFKNHFLICTPLVHVEYEDACIRSFWAWFNSEKSGRILQIQDLLDSSRIGQKLLQLGDESGAYVELSKAEKRAVANTEQTDIESFIQRSLSSKSRRALNRKRRRLSEVGAWSVKFASNDVPGIEALLSDFIAVENKGWKNAAGSSIALNTGLAEFMRVLANYAIETDRLVLSVAYVGEQAVAGVYGVICDAQLLIYKIGYDEEWKNYSVGQLVIFDVVEWAMNQESITRVDSCASPDSDMYNRSFSDRLALGAYRVASKQKFAIWSVVAIAKTRRIRLKIRDWLKLH